MKTAKLPHEPNAWTWVGMAVVLMALSMTAHHGAADRHLQQWLNSGADHWRWWVELLGQLGLGATQWLLLSALLPRAPQPWAAFSLSLVVCGVSVQLLKYLLDLPRPLAVLPPDSLQVLGDALRRRALPSGHTASAFALLGAMMALRWRPLVLVAAALMALAVGWSRVAAGAHWPSDVLAGAALGLACGQLSARSRLALRLGQWAARPSSRRTVAALAVLAMASLLAEALRHQGVGLGLSVGLLAGLAVLWQAATPTPPPRAPS